MREGGLVLGEAPWDRHLGIPEPELRARLSGTRVRKRVRLIRAQRSARFGEASSARPGASARGTADSDRAGARRIG